MCWRGVHSSSDHMASAAPRPVSCSATSRPGPWTTAACQLIFRPLAGGRLPWSVGGSCNVAKPFPEPHSFRRFEHLGHLANTVLCSLQCGCLATGRVAFSRCRPVAESKLTLLNVLSSPLPSPPLSPVSHLAVQNL